MQITIKKTDTETDKLINQTEKAYDTIRGLLISIQKQK